MRKNDGEREKDAQAALDQALHQSGGALSGEELARRLGVEPDPDAPPLDWRMTPKNVILQLLAVLLFVGAIGWVFRALFAGLFAGASKWGVL